MTGRLSSIVRGAWIVPALFAFAFVGCGDDATAPPEASTENSALVRLGSTGGSGEFEVLSTTSSEGGARARGPFLIRGSNIRYDGEAGALAIDMTLTNVGERDVPYPGTLTLLGLMPDGVSVLDADNGETGVGASFGFDFAEDDLLWNVGEESLPRTIRFVVDEGSSVGFVARVDVGSELAGGSIGGVIFEDLDGDGMMGAEEAGLAGARIALSMEGEIIARTESGADGSYQFDGLAAGLYTVTKLPRPFVASTTPTTLQVILVETEEGVSDFLAANFGCLFAPDPPAEVVLEEGTRVTVVGKYDAETGVLTARAIEVSDDEGPEWMELRGPLTDLDAEARRVWIMGAEVALARPDSSDETTRDDLPTCHDRSLEDLEIGEGVRAIVVESDDLDADDALIGYRFGCWRGEPQKVKGWVEQLVTDEDGFAESFVAARIPIVLTDDTLIFHDHDEDHDDKDEDED